jgi:PAS domain S-box-containing protein
MIAELKGIEEAVATLAGDPAFARFVGAAHALLVFDSDGEQLLWASPAAAPLARRIAGGDGRVRLSPFAIRVRALAGGLAPRDGVRLERLRLPVGAMGALATCACRRLSFAPGEEGLLIAIPAVTTANAAEPSPAGPEAPLPSASEPEPAEPIVQAAPTEAAPRAQGTTRFLWHADAEGRFTSVSDALASVVGRSAEVIGRRWGELVGVVVDDPGGAVARGFATGETWAGRIIEWRIADSDLVVPVDFGGMPIHSRDGRLLGFRGFGLCRTDELVERPRALAELAADEDLPVASRPAQKIAEAAHLPAPEAVEAVERAEADDGQITAAAPGTPLDCAPPVDPAPPEQPPSEALAPAKARPSSEELPRPSAEACAGRPVSFPDIGGSVAGRLGDPRIPLRLAGSEGRAEPPSDPQAERTTAEEQAATPPRLSFTERSAFREIARALGARFEDEEPAEAEGQGERGRSVVTPLRAAPRVDAEAERILERLPVGILIHRGDDPLFANRLLLDLVDYEDVGQLAAEGGVPRLFRGRPGPLAGFNELAPLALTSRANESVAVEVRLTTVEWDGLPASLMLVRKAPEAEQGQRLRALELELRARDARLRELTSILDTATDGVLVLDDQGRVVSLNRSAEALFGYDQKEVVGERFIVLLAPESHGVALEYLDGLRANGVASLLNDGRQVFGRVRQGGTIPLFMTVGRVAEGPDRKFCAVLRDITAFKKTEGELLAAKRAAEEGSAQKSDFLAKVSHEIRTPLNAIIGFAEVMLEERFGPIGNERYKDYLRDIHASGGHVISLVNDLLDLAKVEAGRMELAFTSVQLNEIVAACVALMQPQAARERIVMRTSFAQKLPAVVVDERSMRQIVLNIIANAIRFTDAGGQVIVSTALTDRGEVGLRVRDTGVGMSAEDVAAALEPFRQLATARRGGGTGLGLPLTKALVEANRGALRITGARNEGTLVEVLFPPTRVLAD